MMVSGCDYGDEPRTDYNTEAPEQLSNPIPVSTRSDDNKRKPGVLGKWTSVTHRYNTVATRSYKQQFAVSDPRFTCKTRIPMEANIHCVRTDKQVRLCQIWGAHTVWRLTMRSSGKQNRVLYFSLEEGGSKFLHKVSLHTSYLVYHNPEHSIMNIMTYWKLVPLSQIWEPSTLNRVKVK
jgi:hypothetical protein